MSCYLRYLAEASAAAGIPDTGDDSRELLIAARRRRWRRAG